MKLFVIPVFAVAFAGIALTHAQLNINPNVINFRTAGTAMGNTTTHYGDLKLDGGNGGTTWGWLYANRVQAYQGAWFGNEITVSGSITASGSTFIQGDLDVIGVKHFIEPHPTDTTLAIQYVSIEAGEVLTLARGVSKTVNGAATIALPADFDMVTSATAPLSVQLTPEGSPSLLFVKSKSKKSIIVEIKGVDFREYGDVEFSYQVTGVRNGYENVNPIVKFEAVVSPNPKQAKTANNPAEKKRDEFRERIRKNMKSSHK